MQPALAFSCANVQQGLCGERHGSVAESRASGWLVASLPHPPCFLFVTNCCCCCCCCLLQVKLLVEVGAADPCLPDRWQQTALDEARKSGALPVVSYLATKVPGVEANLLGDGHVSLCASVPTSCCRLLALWHQPAERVSLRHLCLSSFSSGSTCRQKLSMCLCPVACRAALCCAAAEAAKAQLRAQQSLVSALLDAARQGQRAQVAQLLERGCAPDAADAEGRTPLMLAAAHGRQVGWAAADNCDELG